MPARGKVPCTCHEAPPPAGVIYKKKPQKASARAQLVFSVARVHGMTKEKLKGTEDRVRRNATVFMTAGLEYLCEEILRLAIQEAQKRKRVRITPYDIALGIHHNPAFASLVKIAPPEKFPEYKIRHKRKVPTPTPTASPPPPPTPTIATLPVLEPEETNAAKKLKRNTNANQKKVSKPKPKAKAAKAQTKTKKTIKKKKGSTHLHYDLLMPTSVATSTSETGVNNTSSLSELEMMINNHPFQVAS